MRCLCRSIVRKLFARAQPTILPFLINDLECFSMLWRPLRFLPFLAVLAGCATTLQTIPPAWMSVPATTRIRSVVLGADGNIAPSSQPAALTVPKGPIKVVTNAVGPMIANAEKALTDPFLALDSFDLSEIGRASCRERV